MDQPEQRNTNVRQSIFLALLGCLLLIGMITVPRRVELVAPRPVNVPRLLFNDPTDPTNPTVEEQKSLSDVIALANSTAKACFDKASSFSSSADLAITLGDSFILVSLFFPVLLGVLKQIKGETGDHMKSKVIVNLPLTSALLAFLAIPSYNASLAYRPRATVEDRHGQFIQQAAEDAKFFFDHAMPAGRKAAIDQLKNKLTAVKII